MFFFCYKIFNHSFDRCLWPFVFTLHRENNTLYFNINYLHRKLSHILHVNKSSYATTKFHMISKRFGCILPCIFRMLRYPLPKLPKVFWKWIWGNQCLNYIDQVVNDAKNCNRIWFWIINPHHTNIFSVCGSTIAHGCYPILDFETKSVLNSINYMIPYWICIYRILKNINSKNQVIYVEIFCHQPNHDTLWIRKDRCSIKNSPTSTSYFSNTLRNFSLYIIWIGSLYNNGK